MLLRNKKPRIVGFVTCLLRVPLASLGSKSLQSAKLVELSENKSTKPTVQGILSLSRKLYSVSYRGIELYPRSTNALILTGGTNTGSMKLMGEAVRAGQFLVSVRY